MTKLDNINSDINTLKEVQEATQEINTAVREHFNDLQEQRKEGIISKSQYTQGLKKLADDLSKSFEAQERNAGKAFLVSPEGQVKRDLTELKNSFKGAQNSIYNAQEGSKSKGPLTRFANKVTGRDQVSTTDRFEVAVKMALGTIENLSKKLDTSIEKALEGKQQEAYMEQEALQPKKAELPKEDIAAARGELEQAAPKLSFKEQMAALDAKREKEGPQTAKSHNQRWATPGS